MFDLVVVGEGGGPDETNLSGYLLKPSDKDWKDGIIALEAGSGLGALQKLINNDSRLFNSTSALEVYSYVHCFLVTHAHLDHVNGLVLSAGTLSGPRKRVYASRQTLQDLESVFADRIWPNLASWDKDDGDYKLLYTVIGTRDLYEQIIPGVSVRYFPVSHGHNERGDYDSAAFFIRHNPTGHEFLFFGDVEPDLVSRSPKTINVWRAAAPKIPATLQTIFIECSWPSSRSDDTLYGHLSPVHLVHELETLASEIVKVRNSTRTSSSLVRPKRKKQRLDPAPVDLRGSLTGLRVFVTHCKDTLNGAPDRPNQTLIMEEIKALLEPKELGVEIIAARQGMRVQI
ncbi:hypothetical protein MIND_01064000 [Mycena indigotica]|uniref:Cyclic-AMP phosphodiesterase n=1 Tax=Mycena indigotica TaxID=2126181 RepID=A0A8H6S955_9AGAR|nr:uncharacterized protein MIND_01064000 [Mycena indigotica]KAF7295251.1 hypothetical protein MIND_01064000 [Mycena indigotica]